MGHCNNGRLSVYFAVLKISVLTLLSLLLFISLLPSAAFASDSQLSPENLLLLVNENSPTSRYIAKMYRWYYMDLPEENILTLSGLPDCCARIDGIDVLSPIELAEREIISRQDYENLIAQPVRDYLTDPNHPQRYEKIRVIVTTAGMPYRIADTDDANVVYPGGSNASAVSSKTAQVNAASVESELTCLWADHFDTEQFSDQYTCDNRVVNPYHGYKSPILEFPKLHHSQKYMNWETVNRVGITPPVIEAIEEDEWTWPPTPPTYVDRNLHAGDIYLVCRLDGPKFAGSSAIYAVRNMLERARRASTPSIGLNPAAANIVLDDVNCKDSDKNYIYNHRGSIEPILYNPNYNNPPNLTNLLNVDDYYHAFYMLTGTNADYYGLSACCMPCGLAAFYDGQNCFTLQQCDLEYFAADDPNRTEFQGIIAWANYGCNSDEGKNKNYILTGLDGSGPLFNCLNGAVFTSIESFNAVTMISDFSTTQAKIIDFITIGGTAAIGHAFEPVSDAIVDNLQLYFNLFEDADQNNIADLTFVEAAYSAIPYLSWSEVVIGDPLMKIAYNPNAPVGPAYENYQCINNSLLIGNTDLFPIVPYYPQTDGVVDGRDIFIVKMSMGGNLYSEDQAEFNKYLDIADIYKDGIIDGRDYFIVKNAAN
jgi:hypothetical protein